ncbi:hypothetical protein ASD86_24375 [Lysobacter sp. Root690]|nr:hypothetical protein ASD86_24375 [Lysobacter sp. Root690]
MHTIENLLRAAALSALIGVLWTPPARADSWEMPVVKSYFSADRNWRLEVRPRPIASQLDYFQDKVDDRDNAGGRAGETQKTALATMQRLHAGQWRTVWDGPLLNEVAPVDALVSPSGQAVTIDDWHGVGFGPRVVVIYDAGGKALRSLALKDFLPKPYIATLERSVSSIRWGGDHRISADGRRLLLQVVVPRFGQRMSAEPDYVERQFDLSTGQPLPGDTRAWAGALKAVERYEADRRAEAAAYEAWLRAPLLAPRGDDVSDWYRYLGEAALRLDSHAKPYDARSLVIRLPGDPDQPDTLERLAGYLTNENADSSTILLASPSQDVLVQHLRRIAASVPAGRLDRRRVYVVADAAHHPQVQRAMARTGAQYIRIDPAEPIAQRPGRMQEYSESKRNEERWRNAEE